MEACSDDSLVLLGNALSGSSHSIGHLVSRTPFYDVDAPRFQC